MIIEIAAPAGLNSASAQLWMLVVADAAVKVFARAALEPDGSVVSKPYGSSVCGFLLKLKPITPATGANPANYDLAGCGILKVFTLRALLTRPVGLINVISLFFGEAFHVRALTALPLARTPRLESSCAR